ncbi:MAG: biphenyl 2,3-dioxygenase [Synechococcales cyanobacterium T60_A2020_003]|nr:biphenyl 2,3-dioxygenase [Synechococcales cyanobacterium T60_A2020_003]
MTISARFPTLQAWIRVFSRVVVLVLIVGLSLVWGWDGAIAATRAPQSVSVHLGTPSGELKFVPDHLQFQVGQRYVLKLDNPSPEKHYFTAKNFADTIWTQKVEAGNVEIKGAIRDLELRPSTTAEWYFVPQKAGEYELHCSIPGHAEAGMRGTISVVE